MLVTASTNMTHIWRHPKYYAELRAARKKLQAQEGTSAKRVQPEVASNKQQAQESSSVKRQASSEERYRPQASSDKQIESLELNPSLTSAKIQVPGNNLQEP